MMNSMKVPLHHHYLTRPSQNFRFNLSNWVQYPIRHYAIQTSGAPTIEVFNNNTKWLQKERAASNPTVSRQVDYLRDEVAARLCDRLLDINRSFDSVLDYGAGACNFARILADHQPAAHHLKPATPSPSSSSTPAPLPAPLARRIAHLTAADTSPTLLARDASLPFNGALGLTRHVLPSPEHLPFAPASFSAVVSALSLHWINDLPSVLAQIHAVLRPDAPLVACMVGGDTLHELRGALQLASLERRGGVAQHVSPMADVKDVGGLLQKAGFGLLTVDVDDVVVQYPDMWALMRDLQDMGEANCAVGREDGPIRRDVLAAAGAIYKELYGERGEDGQDAIPATFRLIWMIGWKEGEGQQKPMQRGSGMVSIKDVLEGKVSMPDNDKKK